jgi:hypothetical protein
MRSPVFGKALGECNAIKSRVFGRSELTFVSDWRPRSTLPRSRFRALLARLLVGRAVRVNYQLSCP